MIGMSNHLLSIEFGFHYHSQKVIRSLGYVSPFLWKMELSHVPCVFFFLRGIRVASGVDAGVLLCCILFIDGRSQGFF